MKFIDSIKTCAIKYKTFEGRSSRSEYFNFVIFIIILSIVCGFFDRIILGVSYWEYSGFGPMTFIYSIAAIPGFAAAVRRLHDVNKSGWWQLIALTIIGLIPLIIWLASEGKKKKNKYGSPARLKK